MDEDEIKYKFVDMGHKCPRCNSESADIGMRIIEVGRTRKMRTNIRLCSGCGLIFYEYMPSL